MALLEVIFPEAEKDQHDPHCPWFWIGDTLPNVTQSIPLAGGAASRLISVLAAAVCKLAL